MQFTVNDQSCEAYLDVRRCLLDFLRDHLQLAGTKKGRSWQILGRLQTQLAVAAELVKPLPRYLFAGFRSVSKDEPCVSKDRACFRPERSSTLVQDI